MKYTFFRWVSGFTLLGLLEFCAFGANPSFQSFDTNYFITTGNVVSLRAFAVSNAISNLNGNGTNTTLNGATNIGTTTFNGPQSGPFAGITNNQTKVTLQLTNSVFVGTTVKPTNIVLYAETNLSPGTVGFLVGVNSKNLLTSTNGAFANMRIGDGVVFSGGGQYMVADIINSNTIITDVAMAATYAGISWDYYPLAVRFTDVNGNNAASVSHDGSLNIIHRSIANGPNSGGLNFWGITNNWRWASPLANNALNCYFLGLTNSGVSPNVIQLDDVTGNYYEAIHVWPTGPVSFKWGTTNFGASYFDAPQLGPFAGISNNQVQVTLGLTNTAIANSTNTGTTTVEGIWAGSGAPPTNGQSGFMLPGLLSTNAILTDSTNTGTTTFEGPQAGAFAGITNNEINVTLQLTNSVLVGTTVKPTNTVRYAETNLGAGNVGFLLGINGKNLLTSTNGAFANMKIGDGIVFFGGGQYMVGDVINSNTIITDIGLTATYSGVSWDYYPNAARFTDVNGSYGMNVSHDGSINIINRSIAHGLNSGAFNYWGITNNWRWGAPVANNAYNLYFLGLTNTGVAPNVIQVDLQNGNNYESIHIRQDGLVTFKWGTTNLATAYFLGGSSISSAGATVGGFLTLTNRGYIVNGVTNFYALPTNDVPSLWPAGWGATATTTNGQIYVGSNSAWVLH